jgi:flagellar motor protein MotB
MSRRRKNSAAAAGPSDDWLLTFSDVLTLLITFFVLLISMSSMDSQRMLATFGFFKGALGNLESGGGQRQHLEGKVDTTRPPSGTGRKRKGADLGLSDRLKQRISALMRASELLVARVREFRDVASTSGTYALDVPAMDLLLGGNPVVLERTPSGAELKVHLGLLFATGSTSFRLESRPLLSELTSLLHGQPITSIETPLAEKGATSRLNSPWDLAGWRSAALVRLLKPRSSAGIAASVTPGANGNHVRVVLVEQTTTAPIGPTNGTRPELGEENDG